MNNQQSLPAEPSDHEQRRSHTRLPPDRPEMYVIVGKERKLASVLNESFGGIGVTLEMEDSVNVQVGDQLTVLHYEWPTPGQVQWIQRTQEVQRVRLGIRWMT